MLPGMNSNPLGADPDPSICPMSFSRLGPFPGLLFLVICDSRMRCSGWPLVMSLLCDCARRLGTREQRAELCFWKLPSAVAAGQSRKGSRWRPRGPDLGGGWRCFSSRIESSICPGKNKMLVETEMRVTRLDSQRAWSCHSAPRPPEAKGGFVHPAPPRPAGPDAPRSPSGHWGAPGTQAGVPQQRNNQPPAPHGWVCPKRPRAQMGWQRGKCGRPHSMDNALLSVAP